MRYIPINFLFCLDSGRNKKFLELRETVDIHRLRVSKSAEGLKAL